MSPGKADIRPAPCQFQRRLPTHAKADGADLEPLRVRHGPKRGKGRGQPQAVMADIRPQRVGQWPRCVEPVHRLAIEIGDHGDESCLSQHPRLGRNPGGDVGDGRQDQHGPARRPDRAGKPSGQRRPAIGIGDLFKALHSGFAHSGKKSGTERYRSPVS